MEKEQYASAIPDKAHQFPQYNYADQAVIGQTAVSYNVSQKSDNGSSIGALPSNLVYHHDPTKDSALSRDHAGSVVAANASTSSYGVANGPPDNSSYSFYPSSTNTYGYNSTDYHNYYYSNYQQQGSHTYPQQQVGSYQNTGSYQPLNSFHNANSYVATSTYSATHDDPGVIQNVGAYQAYGYNNQGSSWSSGQYGAYYPNYQATDANNTSSSIPSNLSNQQYQQPYNPWASYYGQAAPDPNCAPGTENVSAGVTSMLDHSIPGVSSGYTINSAQPPPPGTSAWQGQPADSNVSGITSFQEPSPFIEKSSVSWTQGNPTVQNPYQNNTPLHFQNPLGSAQFSENSHSSYNSIGSQGPAVNLPFSSISENPHNLESPMQAMPPLESHKVPKLQIPTNPRITSTFPSGLQKLDKDHLVIAKANKPAYVSVSVPMPSSKESVEATESMLRPGGAFPASLRAYVERALARCKDDCQKLACQDIMKEIIKNASANGTLFTRDWDTEPLFPLPNASSAGVNEDPQSSMPFFDLSKTKRSPSRRIKSRWEPISDEKLLERFAQASQDQKIAANFNGLKDKDSLPSSRKSDGKVDGGWGSNINSNVKVFSSPQQTLLRKAVFRPEKKQRLASSLNVAENGENSSDSDKESCLTAYYSAAQALSDSPEEKRRRENRYKRFEAIHGNHATPKQSKAKAVGSQNAFARRSSALMLVRGRDDTTGRAVEDIDWDALTMKGTCQEIEKRYLRLTSAPDPSTVRPEEVLEKALLMVQTTQKNYLYKCDQLKSIRQDLTVQRIRNKLTVKVYETHARLALEAGDLPEYNQCQSQLKGLYSEGIEGSQLEFAAYNLLCAILHSNNNRDLLSSMASLPLEAKKDESVRHALAVQAAVATGNYVTFFRLYCTAPNLSTCLMDLYVEKMRFEAVRCLSRAYRPTIPVSFIAHILGFGSTTADEGSHVKDPSMLECEEWLRAHGGCLIVDNTGELMLDAKATTSSLYMPDPEDAVAHGDATLDVNDFLTRT